MTRFIEWSNANNGFSTLVISIIALFISIVSLIVSFYTAKLPYKKKLLLTYGTAIDINQTYIYIKVTNVGHRKAKINNLTIEINGKQFHNVETFMDSRRFLEQGEFTTQYYKIEDIKEMIISQGISKSSNNYLYAYVEDTEGKKYKKRMQKIKTLFLKH